MAPYTFQWSNSQTAQSVSNLSYGYYTVVITDANGCDKTKDFHINRNSPVNLSLVSSVQPSCNGSDGSLTVSASGGTAPYTYVWSNGQTTSTASNLNEGGYHVSVKDQGGCSAFLTAWLKEPANCYVNISGQVLNDKNGDCYSDNNERGLAAVLVSCQPYYYTVSDYNGYFNFTRKVGGPFTLSQAPTPYFSQICPANPPYYVLNPAGGSSTFNTFYNQAKVDTNDLGVVIVPVNIPRPGFENRYDIYYYNAGNTVLNGEVTFAHDPALVFTGALPMAQNYNSAAHTASFTFTDLEPHRGGYIRAYTMVPAGTPLGTKLCNDASITPVTGDIYPGNNHYQACHEVTGSYDPNFVEVTPAGAGAPGYISPKDSILSYMIHFQNTGTDTAFTVAVVDTLDPNLNVATFEKGPSSHPCRISIVKGVMTVTFDNILLPDSNIDEKGSHGYISYSVHMKKDRPAGTQIKSKGNIYFDYNIPVVTNEALNTIQYPLGISEARAGVVNISPNPAGSSANVTIKDLNGYYDFTVFDVTGKIVRRIRNSSLNHFELERGSLKSGVYFYKLESGSGTQFGKIVFE